MANSFQFHIRRCHLEYQRNAGHISASTAW